VRVLELRCVRFVVQVTDWLLSAQKSKLSPSGLKLRLWEKLAVSKSSQLGCRISCGTYGAKNDCNAIE
jgi:predicted metal-binding protein